MNTRTKSLLVPAVLVVVVLVLPPSGDEQLLDEPDQSGHQFFDCLPGIEHRTGIRGSTVAGPGGVLGSGGLHLGHSHHPVRSARVGGDVRRLLRGGLLRGPAGDSHAQAVRPLPGDGDDRVRDHPPAHPGQCDLADQWFRRHHQDSFAVDRIL